MNTGSLLIMSIIVFVVVLVVLEIILTQLTDIGGLFGDRWYHKVFAVVAVILLIILELSLANIILDLFNQL